RARACGGDQAQARDHRDGRRDGDRARRGRLDHLHDELTRRRARCTTRLRRKLDERARARGYRPHRSRAHARAGRGERAASRRARPRDPEDTRVERLEWVRCDVRSPASLVPAFEGIACVYYLVHGMGEAGHDFAAVDRASAEAVARVAADSGVERIVYLGGVEPRGAASEHLASRLEVGRILRAGKVEAVELRASMIVGNGSASWQILRDLAVRLPFMLLPRWLESASCPIALADVVTALLDARRIPLPGGESAWFDIPGPEVLRARDM